MKENVAVKWLQYVEFIWMNIWENNRGAQHLNSLFHWFHTQRNGFSDVAPAIPHLHLTGPQSSERSSPRKRNKKTHYVSFSRELNIFQAHHYNIRHLTARTRNFTTYNGLFTSVKRDGLLFLAGKILIITASSQRRTGKVKTSSIIPRAKQTLTVSFPNNNHHIHTHFMLHCKYQSLTKRQMCCAWNAGIIYLHGARIRFKTFQGPKSVPLTAKRESLCLRRL